MNESHQHDWKDLMQGRLLTEHEIAHLMAQHQLDLPLELLKNQLESQECISVEKGVLTCGRCHNQVSNDFASLSNKNRQKASRQEPQGFYCLNCLQMGRMIQGERLYFSSFTHKLQPLPNPVLTWQGTLSPEQARASQELIISLNDPDRPHAIIAVTGAGKTEMIFPVIGEVLEKGGRVAIASPRIDVCLELYPRLKQAFSRVPLLLLYGEADEPYRFTPLVICTTHQLLRFRHAFELLIVDEVDAFPYVGDASLHFAVKRAVKPSNSKLVYLTATPDRNISQSIQRGLITQTLLPARYHGFPLPEPQFKWVGDWSKAITNRQSRSLLLRLLKEFLALDGVKLIFMPKIKLAEALFEWLTMVLPEVRLACVHAKDPERKAKVQALRDGDYEALISTTILERGVTFTNCQVCIVGAEDTLYSTSALVQMSGRVGRKSEFPTGQLLYVHGGTSRSMKRARRQIQQMNLEARAKGLLTS